MQNAVFFPNLGIRFGDVPVSVSVFGISVSYYGILMGIALAAGIAVTCVRAVKTRQKAEDYLEIAIAVTAFGVIGARLFYAAFALEYLKDDPARFFRFSEGGFALYGALLGGAGAVFLMSRIKGLYPLVVLDTAAPGLAVGIAIGRWGDFFARGSFGEYTDGIFAMQIPVSAVRAADVTEMMRNHVVQIEETNFVQVHPTFLYESVWCLLLAVCIFLASKKRQQDGELFLIFLLGYGLGRFWIEGFRTDSLLIPGVESPVSQVISVFLVLFSAMYFIYKRAGQNGHIKPRGGGMFGRSKKRFFGK